MGNIKYIKSTFLQPLHPKFRGIPEKERQGYFVSEEGYAVRPKKPKHFKPLDYSPGVSILKVFRPSANRFQVMSDSEIEEMNDDDLDYRYMDNLMKRKTEADRR